LSDLEISRILTVIASIVITIGLYMQMIKIYKTQSAKDFDTILVISLVANEYAWLNYGLNLHEWPVILISGLNLPAVTGIGIGYIKYRNSNRSVAQNNKGDG
jgi:MtN3 and saliva related transmembrane protein